MGRYTGTMQDSANAKLILVQGTSIASWLIKRATQSPYSHVGLVIGGLTYEMDFGGFHSRPVESYPWPHSIHEIDGMTPEKTRIVLRRCLMFKDARYDYGKVLGQGFEIFLAAVGIRSILDCQAALSCTEITIAALEAAGYQFAVGQACATPASVSKEKFVLT